MDDIHISLAPEIIGRFLGVPISGTLLMSFAVVLILTGGALLLRCNLAMTPGKVQTLFEWAISFVLDYMSEVLESRKLAERLFPVIATIFLFIFAGNILEFTPGIGSVGFYRGEEFAPLLRSLNTDLNVTLALALISFFLIEFLGVATLGILKYAGKFVNFRSPLSFMIGVIELFSELARLIAFSFRLFGNIFAGEVLILIVSFFVPLFLPVPLMLFEVFVGFIQAAIFALLTLFFVKIAVTEAH